MQDILPTAVAELLEAKFVTIVLSLSNDVDMIDSFLIASDLLVDLPSERDADILA